MKNFDFIAALYDGLVSIVFGNKLYRAQVSLFRYLPQNASILVIGGGTGVFLDQLIDETSPVSIDYLEVSKKMLDIANRRHQNHKHIRFICGDQNSEFLKAEYDIVLIPFVFDLYNEPELVSMVQKIKEKLKSGAIWLVTDFYINADSLLLHRILLKTMYLFFGLVSGVKAQKLPDYKSVLEQSKLQVVRQQVFVKGFVRSIIYK
jgi:tRNA (cmo5U34)-methyltransferase